jgi:rhamnosyltransferase
LSAEAALDPQVLEAMDLSRREVLAVVVTYNPGPELTQNLQALRSQIDAVLVVDNGSANVGAVREAVAATGCMLEENGSNLGIATALNRGVTRALDSGAAWLATFDQDSFLPEHAIRDLLALCARHPRSSEIGLIAPAHRDRGTQGDYHVAFDIIEATPEWNILRATITSGSLIRREAFLEIGGFEERLFIDSVDHEFCLRMRGRGWLVVEHRRVVMPHSIGAATQHRLLGLQIICSHHSPVRRYYITRNLLEVCLRNLAYDPVWSTKALLQLAKSSAVSVTYEHNRLANARAILAGLRDCLLRRFGKLA